MREEFYFSASDGKKLHCVKWVGSFNPKAVVQISHGMMEYIERYDEVASFLLENGYFVVGHSHRGHGKTSESVEMVGITEKTDTFNRMVLDLREITDFIKKEFRLPVILFGHSFGSFLSQAYIETYGSNIDGVILSGTTGKMGLKAYSGLILSYLLKIIFGGRHKSKLLNFLTFAPYNSGFKPNRTKVDWLSSDEVEVDKYLDDPYCGRICSLNFFFNIFKGLITIHRKKRLSLIPKNLRVLIIAGSRDPVGDNLKTISWLSEEYVKRGISSIKVNIYENFRHECLHETGRERVFKDIVNWLDYEVIFKGKDKPFS
ncbi:MAG: alpha/beta fold hydrolase [Brevinematia bacterium]